MSSADNLVKEATENCGFIELTIEPISGQSFTIDAMLLDTILDVKEIIQITSGIQSDKQHLVWRSLELQDTETLASYGIQDGATIRLIPAMRGGPISMRYVEPEIRITSASDDQLAQDLADLLAETSDEGRHSNKRAIIVIVYSNDQQFHFIRLVDGESTETSTSSETSSSLLLDGQEKDLDRPKRKSKRTVENELTQERMLQLRENMDNKSTMKKALKEGGTLPGSQSQNTAPLSMNSLLTASSQIVPVVGKVTMADVTDSTRSSTLTLLGGRPSTGSQTSPRPDRYIKKTTAVVMPRSLSASPHVSTPGLRSPHRPAPGARSPGYHAPGAQSPIRPSHIVQPVVVIKTSSALSVTTVPDTHQIAVQDSDSKNKKTKKSGLRVRTKRADEISLNSNTEKANSDPATNYNDGRRSLLPRLSVDNATGWNIQSSSSVRMSLTNALSSTINAVLSGGSGGASNLLNSSYLLIGSAERLTPLTGRQLSATTLARSFNDIVIATNEQGHSSLEKMCLVNPNRCAICRKKTGLTTSFVCKCGSTFCAVHRYPEEHMCTFDYKAEGRKTIEHDNPVVRAPKLPKI